MRFYDRICKFKIAAFVLHICTSGSFTCKCIIGENGERKDLIRVRNNNGETPIFRAVLTGRTKAFVYLLDVSKDLDVSLTNDHEDTILHQAIWREFFGKLLNLLNLYLVPSIYIDVQSF